MIYFLETVITDFKKAAHVVIKRANFGVSTMGLYPSVATSCLVTLDTLMNLPNFPIQKIWVSVVLSLTGFFRGLDVGKMPGT